MAKRILLVDDEPLILKGLRFTLEQEGYEILTAADGEEALQVFFDQQVDLVLLDVMLPKLDGISVCQRIREHSNVPIIMLTAKGEDMDKILGLEYGADDYMTKPFNILEVKARIKTIFRRTAMMQKETTQSVLAVRDMRINLNNRSVVIGDREVGVVNPAGAVARRVEWLLEQHDMRAPEEQEASYEFVTFADEEYLQRITSKALSLTK